MSTIFMLATLLMPRIDATIRVKKLKPQTLKEDGTYVVAELLEFHPDMTETKRGRGSSYAHVKPHPELLLPEHSHIYPPCGEGYLPEPYLRISEMYLYHEDVREMLSWCQQNDYRPIIVHKCPLPYPVFKRGARVRVIAGPEAFLNQEGTVTSFNSGFCRVKFEKKGIIRTFDALHLTPL